MPFSNLVWETIYHPPFPPLRHEDRRCMAWLDSQQSGSVIFVSFGSLAKLSRVQLLEFWHGLINSGKPFLWVVRSDMLSSEQEEHAPSVELEGGTKERGYIAEWVPQCWRVDFL